MNTTKWIPSFVWIPVDAMVYNCSGFNKSRICF